MINLVLNLITAARSNLSPPKVPPSPVFYESGKACYVQGTFYESCPKQEWQ